jgi:hypothetical protein
MAAGCPAGSAETGARFLYSLETGPMARAKKRVKTAAAEGEAFLAGVPDYRALLGDRWDSRNNLTLVRRVIVSSHVAA